MMERTEWLRRMRQLTADLYDHMSPLYWVKFGLRANPTHSAYLQKLLKQVPPNSRLLSAACGAGLHDGVLLELEDCGPATADISILADCLSTQGSC